MEQVHRAFQEKSDIDKIITCEKHKEDRVENNIYENELLPEDKTDENIKEYSQFEGLNDEWEDFNERDFDNS